MPTAIAPDGARIYYETLGKGVPFALAHGFGVSMEMWWPQRNQLARHCQLILWDARGHGDSDAPADPAAYSMPILARDLRAVLEAAGAAGSAATPAIIGGMSFGGQIAMQYAADFPDDVRALVISDAVTRGPAVSANALPTAFRANPGLAGCYEAMQHRPDLTAVLPSLAAPALLIWGEADTWIGEGVARTAGALRDRRTVMLRGSGHGTSSQRPDDWADVVLTFLNDVLAGRPVHGEQVR